MGGFLHFVETGQESLTLDQCAKLGLSHALTKTPSCRKSQLALDGPAVAGLLVWQSTDFATPQGVNVDRQTWRLRGEFDGVRVWTGFDNDDPPTPELLFLGRSLRCLPWTDAQGREWSIPVVGDVDDVGGHEPRLPREMDFREDGTPTRGEVVSRYRELWTASKPLWSVMVNTGSCDTAEAAAFASKCFAALYRVSPIELGLLGVFSEEALHSPEVYAAAAIGYYSYTAWRDAKERDPLSVSAETTDSATTDGKAA